MENIPDTANSGDNERKEEGYRCSNLDGVALIKKEFLSLNKKAESSDKQPSTNNETKEEKTEDSNSEPPRKKLKGQNKKRPREARIPKSEKLCFQYSADQTCKYNDHCTFSHDVASFLSKKPADIGNTCYAYETYGRCPYGLSCRYGSVHTSDDQKNVINEDLWNASKDKELYMNNLSRDLQINLRTRKFDFKRTNDILKEIQQMKLEKEKTSEEADNKNSNDVAVGPVTDEDKIRLRKSEIKKIDFKNKLYLAPLTTVGNLPFRRICKELGVDITCGEMALCANILQGQQSEWALLRRHHTEDIFGVQVCGAHPDMMTRCAQVIDENANVDFVDINMGCPIDLVYKKGAGSGLMGKFRKLQDIVYGMSSVLSVPLTIKIRTGIYESKNLADTLIAKLKSWSCDQVSLITLHGRSREQRYTKNANWDYISKCASVADPIPLFGNGDILSYEDYNFQRKSTEVSGIMIARGALIKPWIFTEIKEQRHWDISSTERFDIIKKYANYGLEQWGSDTEGVEKTRRFLLEWLSFLYRYIPVGVLERVPQKINERPPSYIGRNDLETMMASPKCTDWVKLSEMVLGPVRENFVFLPKHKANSYT